MNTTVLPETGEDAATAASGCGRHLLQQFVDDFDVVMLGEELGDRLSHDLADAVECIQLGPGFALGMRCRDHLIAEMFCRTIGPRQHPRRGLAHMADAEGEDEAVKRNAAPLLDGGEQLPDAGLAPALAVAQLLQGALVARLQA